MCEVLIRTQDKTVPGDEKRAMRMQRGDVIVVMPDGWRWSERELTNPGWRLLRLPGLPPEAMIELQVPVRDKDGVVIAKRARGIDLDSIPQVEAAMRSGRVVELPAKEASDVLAASKLRSAGVIEIG